MNKEEKYEATIGEMSEFTYQWASENFDDPSKPILKISKSSLGTFNWCPKKYEFNYIERRPQDQSEAMRKGTVLHNHRKPSLKTLTLRRQRR